MMKRSGISKYQKKLAMNPSEIKKRGFHGANKNQQKRTDKIIMVEIFHTKTQNNL